MNGDSGRILAGVLREQVRDVPPLPAGLADRARHAARRRRRHQVVGLGATVVVAAAALALPTVLGGGVNQRAGPLPAAPAGPRVDLDVSRAEVTTIDATGLRRGPDPATAWTASGILRRTDGRSLQLPDGALGAVELPDGGALVTAGTTVRPTLSFVDRDGHAQPPFAAAAPVVDPTGQVAYLDLDKHLVVRQKADGTGSAVTVPFPDDGVTLVGFLGDDLVADLPFRGARLIRRDGTSAALRGLAVATATDAPSGTVALRSRDGACLELRRDDALLWRSCRNAGRFASIVDISPDGHRVLLRRDKSGHPGTSQYAVAVAETGRVVRLFSAAGRTLGLGQAVFERGSLLVAAYHDEVARIVRCDQDGACQVTAGDTSGSASPFTPVWFP